MAEASLNDELRDLSIRHSVGVQRLSSGTISRLIPLLDASDREIVLKLQSRDPTLQGSFTSQRLQQLLQAIREINHDAHVELGKELRQELRDLARYEADFQTRMISGQLPVAADFIAPSVQALDAIVTSRPFGGKLLRDAVKGLETGKFQLLKDAIQLGMIQGETTDQIVRRIRGTRARNFRDGILERPRRAVERMVRTATNHVANAAREKVYEENDDLIKGVQWVATLDTRTCPSCGALDGKVFKLNRGPRPPLHLNCRCSTAPVTKTWREMGFDIDEVPPGTRASMNGQVSATETYNSWLKKQSAAVQDEALGPSRGQMFRAGDLDVDRFTDARGNALNLDQLRRAEGGRPVLRKSSAADLYRPPTKTADELIARHGAADGIRDVNERLSKLKPTDALVSEGGFKLPNGNYTPGRQAVHNKILDDIFSPEQIRAATPRTGQPTLTMLGGRGGSGKSWLTGKDGPVDARRAVLLDSDRIKAALPEYKGWNASQLHEESAHILALADDRATQLGLNTIHDATMKTGSQVVDRMARYEAANYRLEGYYMHLGPEAAAERALERFSKGGTFTGRYVPPEVVLSNVNNEKNFDAVSTKFVKWAVFDNSGAKGSAPRLVQAGGSL